MQNRRHRWRQKLKAWQLHLVKIRGRLDEHPDNSNYGIERIMISLQQKGEKASRSTVIRAMRKGHLQLHDIQLLRNSWGILGLH